jgi:hypothetical protein
MNTYRSGLRTYRPVSWRGLLRGALVLAITSMLTVALAAPALATPKGIFAIFAQCPVADPEVNICNYLPGTGGELTIGSRKVSFGTALTIQGGAIVNEETGNEVFVDAANGETLSKAPLPVSGLHGVTATLELVGTPSISRADMFFQEGVALSLPLRIHLQGRLLGSTCYIGSETSPVTVPLRTGPTDPPPPNASIEGSPGHLKFPIEDIIVELLENRLVENAFAEPGVSGCGGSLSFIVDPLLDARLGLPSAAGHNTMVFEDTFFEATAESVKNSE